MHEFAERGRTDMLEGRTALITGSTQGIGLAIACEMSRVMPRWAIRDSNP